MGVGVGVGGVCGHKGDCFTRGYRKVRSKKKKNQWGNSSAASNSNSHSASQDPLRGIGISRAPNGRIINMTDKGWGRRMGEREQERSCWWEMWDMQVCFQESAQQNFIPSRKHYRQSLHLYSHIFITRAVAEVSFQTLVGSTHAMMSNMHELYKEPWGATLMFPFLCFLSMADITDWKYVSKSHTGCEQREPPFFFLGQSVWTCQLFYTQSFMMCYFNKLGIGGPTMAHLMCSIRFSASDTTTDAVNLLKQSQRK